MSYACDLSSKFFTGAVNGVLMKAVFLDASVTHDYIREHVFSGSAMRASGESGAQKACGATQGARATGAVLDPWRHTRAALTYSPLLLHRSIVAAGATRN